MCRIFEEYGEEIRKETQEEILQNSIIKTIEILREIDTPEEKIRKKLMEKYELTDEALEAYLQNE